MTGRRFGPYELVELLGRGGMGEVHRAVDTRKDRTVALKLLPSALSADHDIRARFSREAQVAARLSDPHVIPIHDYGELHGRLFLDMRLVEGADLSRTLSEGALAPVRASAILTQVAGALDAAHADGLVHRDVTPSNILLTTTRHGEDFVYLIDFGIAATVAGTRLTATGQTVGTAAYMAPERFVEGTENDPRIDVYALGCVLHEMLTGTAPYQGTSFPKLMYEHLHTPAPRFAGAAGLPAGIDDVVATALAKDPAQRYPSAGDLAAAARSVLTPTAPPRPTVPGPPSTLPDAPPAPGRTDPPRFGMPRGEAPRPSTPPRWRMAPAPEPRAPRPEPVPVVPRPRSGPSVRPIGARNRPARTFSAIAALVVHALWFLFPIGAAGVGFTECSAESRACAGGTVGLLAIALGVAGIVLASLVLARHDRALPRSLGLAWSAFGASVVVFVVAMVITDPAPVT